MMSYIKKFSLLLFLLSSATIFAQTDTTNQEFLDPSKNRLFFMSTGYIQSQEVIGFQVHELIGYQVEYSPLNFIQLNVGWGVFRNFIVGGKIELYQSDNFLRAFSLNFDAVYKYQNKEFTRTYFLPNINTTLGFDILQLNLSLSSYTVEKFKRIPVDNSMGEDDGYRGDKKIYLFPALVQTGLMFNVKKIGLKIIIENHIVYNGKKDGYTLALYSFGVRKYWKSSFIDIAFVNFTKQSEPYSLESFFLPYLAFGFYL